MIKTLAIAAAALAMGATALVPVTVDAQRYRGQHYERGYGDHYRDGYRYDRRNFRRYRRGCDNSGGTIVGAIAGGLLGRSIDTRGDRTVGTLGGAVLGGLAGREIDRSDNPGYCRR